MTALILSTLLSCAAWATDPTADDIGRRVWLGEVYPSGNAYLQRFRPVKKGSLLDAEDRPPVRLKDGPEQMMAFGLLADASPMPLHRAALVGHADYLPAKEGMDDSHNDGCKLSAKVDVKKKYLDGSDFFQTISDLCGFEESSETVRYEGEPGDGARQLLATDLYLKSFERARGKRPLTEGERKLVAAEKEAHAERRDCTTEPATLDSAEQLLKVEIEGGSWSLRVSRFQDPGCGGHLATVYVLDALKAGKLEKSFVLAHYHGLI